MRPPLPLSHNSSGFTMVELIVVMVIIGVLSATALPKFFDRSVFDNNGFHDQVIAALRYAQKEAIAQHGFVCVAFTSNSVTLTIGTTNSCGTALANPSGGSNYSLSPGSGSQASFSPTPSNFSFDCMGTPRTIDATGQGVCSNTSGVLTSSQTVQVQSAAAITVEMQTGYVH